ncbi:MULTISPECIES: bacteriohemerythrin [unclassified Sedimentibacter]|uniref:bacteriohemerythrin n=1 Tax=unclassified Sedimentibacter TaxID=2649220 RepID=UPI0027E1FC01|nr:hemerythrin family protein [Sedimentibacter sp. MB35-C1]WMJ76843.1 hemerythrin family protein [Sedimentibacter sp. MB35-C1]
MLWKDKYELGVPLIDNQHKELFRRVELFIQTVKSSADWNEKVSKVNETLEFMKGYVVEHFNAEEGYQRSIEYPGYDMHKKIHDDMVSYVLSVSEEYEKSGCDEKLMLQFAGKLLAWLINHVAADDQNIASYAKEKGVDGNER